MQKYNQIFEYARNYLNFFSANFKITSLIFISL